MASPHEPLKALAPIDWADVPQQDLKPFLDSTFGQAQIIFDSIPATTTASVPASGGRARSKTDSAVLYQPDQRSSPSAKSQESAELSARLQKEWKEVKINPRDNPHDIHVYKLSSRDGKGSWFARRSVHDALTFEQWKAGLQREFEETMKVKGPPGSGSIRGVGADRHVDHRQIHGAGHLDVFQLSAQFPGPTAPRDFITLLLTSDLSHANSESQQPPMRQYIVVSKPCLHPDCPPRQGIIRGQYESCEIIREVPVDPETLSNKRSLSSADLLTNESRRSSAQTRRADVTNAPRAVEWLMICRSEPGGTVPRFLIEKGTPPGIIGDAGKFIDWVSSTISKDGAARKVEEPPPPPASNDGIEKQSAAEEKIVCNGTDLIVASPQHTRQTDDNAEAAYSDWIPSSTGIYGIINGAFGVAGSIATGLKSQLSGALSQDSSQDSLVNSHAIREVDEDAESDASSTKSFASALERSITREKPVNNSTTDSLSDDLKSQQQVKPMEKDLQKLWDRRQKLERSFTQFQEKMESKRQGEKEKDATTQAKLREKHDKEAAKQEAKYKRELRKLEEKREQEEKKAEARRKKAADRQERSSLTLELEKVRAEKQVAIKETELLRAQVGELQAQNTMLVARLGRVGALNREDSSSSQANSTNSKS